jgi:hypothetical protein
MTEQEFNALLDNISIIKSGTKVVHGRFPSNPGLPDTISELEK